MLGDSYFYRFLGNLHFLKKLSEKHRSLIRRELVVTLIDVDCTYLRKVFVLFDVFVFLDFL